MYSYTSTTTCLARQWNGTKLDADEMLEQLNELDIAAEFFEQVDRQIDEDNWDIIPSHIRVHNEVGFVIVLVDQWLTIEGAADADDPPVYRIYSDQIFRAKWVQS